MADTTDYSKLQFIVEKHRAQFHTATYGGVLLTDMSRSELMAAMMETADIIEVYVRGKIDNKFRELAGIADVTL